MPSIDQADWTVTKYNSYAAHRHPPPVDKKDERFDFTFSMAPSTGDRPDFNTDETNVHFHFKFSMPATTGIQQSHPKLFPQELHFDDDEHYRKSNSFLDEESVAFYRLSLVRNFREWIKRTRNNLTLSGSTIFWKHIPLVVYATVVFGLHCILEKQKLARAIDEKTQLAQSIGIPIETLDLSTTAKRSFEPTSGGISLRMFFFLMKPVEVLMWPAITAKRVESVVMHLLGATLVVAVLFRICIRAVARIAQYIDETLEKWDNENEQINNSLLFPLFQ